jgi:hypothetical protein
MAWVKILELSRRYQWYMSEDGLTLDGPRTAPSESRLYTIRIFRSRSIIRAFAGGSLRKWVGGGREGCSEGHP